MSEPESPTEQPIPPTRPDPERPARLADAVLFCVVFLAAQLVLGLVVGVAGLVAGVPLTNLVMAILEAGSFFAVLPLVRRRLRSRVMPLFRKKIMGGKEQLMITIWRRLFIFSPIKLLVRIGIIGCTMLALTYSTCLGLKVRRSEAAAARISAVTNSYTQKNITQAEKCRQIRLLANIFIKSYANSESAIAEHGAFKIIRMPYPSIKEVEKRLGTADEREMSGAAHLIWNQFAWEKPYGWPNNGNIDRAWPSMKSKAVEAWFDSSGRLLQLVIFKQTEDDGSQIVEYVGRKTGDWKPIHYPESSPAQSHGPFIQ